MDSIKLKTVFGKEAVIFTLKILTVAEENKLRQRAFGKTEREAEEKAFETAVSALTEYSLESAERHFIDEDGNEIKQAVPVSQYFETRNPVTERIAHYAFRSYLLALQPSVDFL